MSSTILDDVRSQVIQKIPSLEGLVKLPPTIQAVNEAVKAYQGIRGATVGRNYAILDDFLVVAVDLFQVEPLPGEKVATGHTFFIRLKKIRDKVHKTPRKDARAAMLAESVPRIFFSYPAPAASPDSSDWEHSEEEHPLQELENNTQELECIAHDTLRALSVPTENIQQSSLPAEAAASGGRYSIRPRKARNEKRALSPPPDPLQDLKRENTSLKKQNTRLRNDAAREKAERERVEQEMAAVKQENARLRTKLIVQQSMSRLGVS